VDLHKLTGFSGFVITGEVKKLFTKLLISVVSYSVHTSILGMLTHGSVKL
jgi:hypothetical protein